MAAKRARAAQEGGQGSQAERLRAGSHVTGIPATLPNFRVGGLSRAARAAWVAWENKHHPTVRCFTALVNTPLATNESQSQPVTLCCPSRANPHDAYVAPLRACLPARWSNWQLIDKPAKDARSARTLRG